MKSLITGSFILIFLTAFCYQNSLTKFASLTCTLKSNKTRYKVGEIPDLKVEILNKTSKDIYLIGSLDGSDIKRRMPYCYFTIEKPTPDTIPYFRCGFANPLRIEECRLVKAGETFNPYAQIDNNGFWTDYTITRKETFRNPGIYKLRFHYSTNSTDMHKFLGSWDKNPDTLQLKKLFDNIPKIDLASNVLEINIVE